MIAAAGNPVPAVVTALLSAGAAPDVKDKAGMTPLMYAALSNANPDVISALLDAGANPDATDSRGRTARVFASENQALTGSPVLGLLANNPARAR